jgi:hypothetical protein
MGLILIVNGPPYWGFLHADVLRGRSFRCFGTSYGREEHIYRIYFLLAFVVLKLSNALFEMMARNEILLELCPAETNVLSDAGAIRNVIIEACLLSLFQTRASQPFHPNAHTQFLSCRNGNRKVRFNKEKGGREGVLKGSVCIGGRFKPL